MTQRTEKLAMAVRIALALLAAGTGTEAARAQDSDGAAPDSAPTGTHIRLANNATSALLTVIERAAIARSGKLTLGELLQELPAMGGPLTNPRVNIGGGTGAATLSLHGLGASRTLLLIDGQRTLSDDVNAIPVAAVERIEVLRENASAIYGSAAEGGVVNVILRRDYQGAEFTAQTGISDRGDGRRSGYQFVFGQHSDRGSVLAGVDYNKFDAVLASSRAFSRNALYYYYGAGHVATITSRTPTGQVQLPQTLAAQFGCNTVTLRQLGLSGTSLGDYKCYTAADGFNFQSNGPLDLTPQERSNAFLIGSYRLTDNVQAYLALYHDKTNAASSIAPQYFDTIFGTPVISAQNYYNPFGVDFSSFGNRFKTRTIGNGNRVTTTSAQNDQLSTGFKGGFGDDWQWDAHFEYAHTSQLTHTSGYADFRKLDAALGPSYRDANGQIVCGTPQTGPIAGCTPLNPFDIVDPATIRALDLTANNPFTNAVGLQRAEGFDVSGSLFALPAGEVRVAAGIAHRRDSLRTIRDAIEVPDANGVCDISAFGTGCVASLDGAYSVREAYAEAFVPLLADAPFARALNLTIADRQSKYSSFGSTNNARLGVEWRPHDDLLLRATVADVFRAPTITELYRGKQIGVLPIQDPCFLTTTPNAACQFLPPGGLPRFPGLLSPFSELSGAVPAGFQLHPEHGTSTDFSLRYTPMHVPGLEFTVDAWRLHIDDAIRQPVAQDILDDCFYRNGGPLCALLHRIPSGPSQGILESVQVPFINLGTTRARGADLSARYALPDTRFGGFAVNLQASYLDRYDDDLRPGQSFDLERAYAGHYTTGASPIPNANFARWRALATLDWNRGPWRASWKARYVGKFTVGQANPQFGESACQSSPAGCELKFGATVYHDLGAGYAYEPLNARLDIGIDNAFDEQPPVLYLNNTPNANTDVATFDTVGRFYWARLSLRF